MANMDIHPYGPGGQAPTGLGIADNLNTNSPTVSLSARQGKVVGERLTVIEEKISMPGDPVQKELSTLDGYIQRNYQKIVADNTCRMTQPFVLKKGERLTLTTTDSFGFCIAEVPSLTTYEIGDTVNEITAIWNKTDYEEGTFSFVATDRDYILVVNYIESGHVLTFDLTVGGVIGQVSELDSAKINSLLFGKGEDVEKLYSGKESLRDIIHSKSDFCAFFFSDIHAQSTNMNRIVALANAWKTKLNAILNAGDTVLGIIEESVAWYTNAIAASEVDIILAVGNHDVLEGNHEVDAYTKLIAPTISALTGAVQPADAAANSLLYYYKDYGNLRVISFDTPNASTYGSSQLAAENQWLDGVLDDALANNKHVLILTHYPFITTDVQRIPGHSWDSAFRYELAEEQDGSQTWNIADSTCDIVDDFIDAGGKFVGWFTGHLHYSNFITNSKHTKQVMYNIGTARSTFSGVDVPVTTDETSHNYDQFCYIGIDLTHCYIKLLKIGREIDNQLSIQNTLCWDYKNQRLVSNT